MTLDSKAIYKCKDCGGAKKTAASLRCVPCTGKERTSRLAEEYFADPKRCENCDKIIMPRETPGDSYKRIKTHRRFCGRSCATVHRNHARKKKVKTCERCDSEFNHNLQNKFCSLECANKHPGEKLVLLWLSGKTNGAQANGDIRLPIRRYLIESRDSQCERCGWGEKNPVSGLVPLTIHHVDGDACNHSIDNLEVLCPNCHSLTNTYGALNKNSTRNR